MTERQIELTSLYFDGKAAPADIDELLSQLGADAQFLKEFITEWETHWMLRSTQQRPAHDDVVVKRILHYVRATEDSEKFLAKVKQRMGAQPAPARFNLKFALGAAAAVMLMTTAAILYFRQTPENTIPNAKPPAAVVAQVMKSNNGVTVKRGGAEQVLKSGEDILAGDLVVAAAGDKPILRRTDGTTIQLNSNGGIEFTVADRANFLRQVQGDVFVEAVPQPAENPLTIATPNGVEAIVVGTRFELSVKGSRTFIAVEEGSVRFGRDRGSVLVMAGMLCEAAESRNPPLPSPVRLEAIAAWRKPKAPAENDNLLANPGFEDGFNAWNVEPSDAKGTSCVVVDREPGQKGLVARSNDQKTFVLTQTVSCKPGALYDASALIHTFEGSYHVALRFLDANNKLIETRNFAKTKAIEQNRAGGLATAPANAAKIVFQIHSSAVGFIDDCELKIVK